jgi:hypothetical protein
VIVRGNVILEQTFGSYAPAGDHRAYFGSEVDNEYSPVVGPAAYPYANDSLPPRGAGAGAALFELGEFRDATRDDVLDD